jgi:hypothetical protein
VDNDANDVTILVIVKPVKDATYGVIIDRVGSGGRMECCV